MLQASRVLNYSFVPSSGALCSFAHGQRDLKINGAFLAGLSTVKESFLALKTSKRGRMGLDKRLNAT